MASQREIDYSEFRASTCLALTQVAADPAAHASHLEFARRYGVRLSILLAGS